MDYVETLRVFISHIPFDTFVALFIGCDILRAVHIKQMKRKISISTGRWIFSVLNAAYSLFFWRRGFSFMISGNKPLLS